MKIDELKDKYPNVTFEIIQNDDKLIELSRIIIPKEERNTGIGSKFIEALIQFANKNKLTIILTPSDSFGATSINRLKRFYKRFGFVENRGKNKDYLLPWCGMYKKP